MKRLRDDGSSLQSGFSSGDSCSGGSDQTENDASTYLKEVKETLQYQREKYKGFLMVMKCFFARRTDASKVIAKAKELFEGHNNLISGFNIFLPKGHEIALEDDEAINILTNIEKRFQNDEQVYMAFSDILNEFWKGRKDENKAYYEISILLKGHADLMDEINRFLFSKSLTCFSKEC